VEAAELDGAEEGKLVLVRLELVLMVFEEGAGELYMDEGTLWSNAALWSSGESAPWAFISRGRVGMTQSVVKAAIISFLDQRLPST
jgi:hypothetical protein